MPQWHFAVENTHKVELLPRYHKPNPLEVNDLSRFTLTNDLVMTYLDKIEDDEPKRELVMRGNNLQLRMGRRLRDNDMPLILMFLNNHPEVVGLDLAYNRLTDAGLHSIANYLQGHTGQLEKLNLMCNDIGSRGIEKLAELGDSLTLKSLRLNGNKFGVKGGKALALLLGCNTSLQHLDVGETDQEIASLVYFTTFLRWDRGGNEQLLMLDLSRPHGRWNYQFDIEHFAETVGQMLRYNRVLRELHLQKYGFSDHDLELLMLGLSANRSLRLLDLSGNNIGCEGAQHVGLYLRTRPSLLGLMLARNQISDIGARTLSFALPYSRVKLLDLTYNLITDEGFLDILNSIKKPVVLRCLYMWGNTITHNSLTTVRRMLMSGVLVQEHIDLKIYTVDRVLYAAYYRHVDRYNHVYFCVNDHGFPPPRGIAQEEEASIPTQLTTDHVATYKTLAHKMPHPMCGYGHVKLSEGFGVANKLLDE